MGNRAIITYEPLADENIGVYLHWNGDPSDVLAIVKTAEDEGFRNPCGDSQYGMGRIAMLAGILCGARGSTGFGIGNVGQMDDGDNGVYVIGPDWTVTNAKQAKGRWGDEEFKPSDRVIEMLHNRLEVADI